MVVALPTAPSGAAVGDMSAKLTVGPDSNSIFRSPRSVEVAGSVSMTRVEARALLSSGHKVVIRLWGDDPYYDDLLRGPSESRAFPSEEGLKFSWVSSVSEFTLNEDNAFPLDRDELYAGVRLLTPSGATMRSRESNRITGYF